MQDTNTTNIEHNPKKLGKGTIIAILVVLLLVVGGVFGYKYLSQPNRSAKNAARAAFTATYISFDFNDFMECTIYNDVCQGELLLELTTELSLVEKEFATLEEWMKEAGEEFRIHSVAEELSEPDQDIYKQGIALLSTEYDGVRTSNITRVGKVSISYTEKYLDDNGASQSKDETEILWSFEVGGKWYCAPTLYEE